MNNRRNQPKQAGTPAGAGVVKFTPRAECDAVQNLEGFIHVVRDVIRPFGGLDWESNAWDVTSAINKRGRKGRIAFVFSTFAQAGKKPP
jgi:hypothetical protein